MTFHRSVTVALIAGLMMAFAPAGSSAQVHTPLSAMQIKDMVEHELSKEDTLRNITVAVQGQMVTLTGTVPSLWAKEQAIEEAREVEDVQSVLSELTIMTADSDSEIGEQVAEQIRRYVFYTIFDDLNILVDQGVVRLTGQVTQPYKRPEIVRLVSRVRGVKEIHNQIEVLPASPVDNQRRASIATQIYRHPLFDRYALQVNPPIHIIVKNSNVTLTGVVNSEVEKRVAETIARQTFDVFSLDNRLLPSR